MGAIQFPPLFYLPVPLLTKEGKREGRSSLQRRGLPWEPPTSFQEPTRFPEDPFLGLTEPDGSKVKVLRVLKGAQPYASFKEAIDTLLSTQ